MGHPYLSVQTTYLVKSVATMEIQLLASKWLDILNRANQKPNLMKHDSHQIAFSHAVQEVVDLGCTDLSIRLTNSKLAPIMAFRQKESIGSK